MCNIGPNQSWIRVTVATLFAVVVPMIIFTGCNKNYGRFTMSAQVEADFRTGAVQPEFKYYYAGRDTMPYAIIGVDNSYTVPSRYWIPFAPEPAQLQRMSGSLFMEVRDQPYGAYILDPDGKMVGVWYSTVYNRSVSVDQHTRSVQVLFKNPENDNHL